jgi:hypothetical protein
LRIYELLSGGDRRSIAGSNQVRRMIDEAPSRVAILAKLTSDENVLIAQRALDLLEKVAHDRPELVEPHKTLFLGPLADSDRWEMRLQIVRALPLFSWTPAQMKRAEEILLQSVDFSQTFVRAWALDSLATLADRRLKLAPIVERYLSEFERSPSSALRARARRIRARGAKRRRAGRP